MEDDDEEGTREAELVRPNWMEMSLVVLAVAGGLLLLLDSPLVAVFAVVLFLSCPVAMLIVAVSMRRHGRDGHSAQAGR